MDIPDPCYHNIYRVTLPNGEIWAIDPTGAAFGFDSLYSWTQYREKHTTGHRIQAYALGSVRRGANTACEYLPAELLSLAASLDAKIPVFAIDFGGKLASLIEGTDTTFLEAKEKFLDRVEEEVRAHAATLSVSTEPQPK